MKDEGARVREIVCNWLVFDGVFLSERRGGQENGYQLVCCRFDAGWRRGGCSPRVWVVGEAGRLAGIRVLALGE